jgi:hypothetical protein
MKIFGREPAAWVGLIEAFLFLLTASVLDWSQEQVALVMAVVLAVSGAYTAWVTKDTMLGVVVGLAKAVLTLLIGFGINIAPELMAAILGFTTVAVGFFQRTQTFPVYDPPRPLPGATAVSDVGAA